MPKEAPKRTDPRAYRPQVYDLIKWRENRLVGNEVYWDGVAGDAISRVVNYATRAGAAIMFGRTSDGGALSLVVLHGNQKVKEYPRSPEEAAALLESLIEQFTDAIV